MPKLSERACDKCGLIQLYDELWGLAICDAKEAAFYGCPTKKMVLEKLPNSKWSHDDA